MIVIKTVVWIINSLKYLFVANNYFKLLIIYFYVRLTLDFVIGSEKKLNLSSMFFFSFISLYHISLSINKKNLWLFDTYIK